MSILLNLDPNSVTNPNQDTSSIIKPMFVKAGISSYYYRKRKTQSYSELPKLRILPCFDFSKYHTEEFKTSFVPFKVVSPSGGISYSQWAIPVKGYMFFGNLYEHFLSPATLQPVDQKYPTKYTDPISDLRSFIFFANRQNKTLSDGVTPMITPEELRLIEFPKEPDKFQVLPNKPRVFLLINALLQNVESSEWEQTVVILSGQTFQQLIAALEEKPGRNSPIINQNFEDNLFGDPTDPTTGCVIWPRKCKSTSGLDILGLAPSPDGKTLVGFQQMPIGPDVLSNRQLLNDPDNVLDIWTYQRILDQLCKDPVIPTELLEKAYENNAFCSDAVLNLQLRNGGEELVRAREAAKIAEEAPKVASIHAPTFSAPSYNTPVSTVSPTEIKEIPLKNIEPVTQVSATEQGSKLTPEEEAEYQALHAKAMQGMLDGESMSKYLKLYSKRS